MEEVRREGGREGRRVRKGGVGHEGLIWREDAGEVKSGHAWQT